MNQSIIEWKSITEDKMKRKAPKMVRSNDVRIKGNVQELPPDPSAELEEDTETLPSSMFFSYNQALGPPFRILVDTNMLWQTCSDKIDIFDGLEKCLLAKCIPMVTSCVIAELEKLGRKFHLALKLAKDPRFRCIKCGCRGNYADDCLVNIVTKNRCFVVATNDKDLRRRMRKIPGVPIMYLHNHKFSVERLPDSDYGAPKNF